MVGVFVNCFWDLLLLLNTLARLLFDVVIRDRYPPIYILDWRLVNQPAAAAACYCFSLHIIEKPSEPGTVNPLQTRFEEILEWLEEIVVVVRRIYRLGWGLAYLGAACCTINPPRNYKESLLSVA